MVASVQYRELRPGNPISRVPPRHMEDEIPAVFGLETSLYRNSPAVGVFTIARGHASRFGACRDRWGRWVPWNRAALPADKSENARQWNPFARLRHANKIDGRVGVLTHPAQRGYFHWLFDALPRYALLEQLTDPPQWLYLDQGQSFQRQAAELLSIPIAIVDAARIGLLQARTLLVPSAPSVSGVMPQWVCDWLRDRFGSQAVRVSPRARRIYVSRSIAGRGTVTNENVLRTRLEARGFVTIHSEELSFSDQIAYFQNAELVVGPHGAGLANLVFATAGTWVVELFAENYVNVCYWTLCSQADLNYAFSLAKPIARVGEKARSDMLVDIEKLERLLDLVEARRP